MAIKKNSKSKKQDTIIAHLSYYKAKRSNYYEVQALSDMDKLAFSGECCHGVFTKFLEQAKQHKATIVRSKSPFVHAECKTELKWANYHAKKDSQTHAKIKSLVKNV